MAENRYLQLLNVGRGKAGNFLSYKKPGTSLDGIGVLDHAHRMLPALVGGLSAKSVYTWGVKTFKKSADNSHFWAVASTDEGAGTVALWLMSYLVLRLAPGDTTERFCCGLMGRGSIVAYNTLMRMLGRPDKTRANQPGDDRTADVIANEIEVAPRGLSEAQLDEELIREVGKLALKSDDFRSKVSDGMARRVNEYLESQGRKTIEPDAIHSQVANLFQSMANR